MNVSDCKPGDHLYTMYSYDGVLEVVVLQPLEPIYQDFVLCDFVKCPPGWKSPRYIRVDRLYRTKDDALKIMIAALEIDIASLQRRVDRLQQEVTTKQNQIKALEKQLETQP